MNRIFQRGLLMCATLWVAAIAPAFAQSGQTASSTLVVSMEVQSSISLVFVNSSNSGVGYCQVSGANTSSASLNLGIASISGDNQSCVNWYTSGSNYVLATNLYLEVSEANTTSTSFALTAALGSSPPTGVTWQIAAMANHLTTSAQTVTASEAYNTQYSMYFTVTVANTVASGSLSNTINFVATAN